MNHIRKATPQDASRLAEILIFTKRANYRNIFHNDAISFGEMQVYPLAQDFIDHPEKLQNIWVYDDEFVKGMVHTENRKLEELYVDTFFQNEGIGGKLLDFAVQRFNIQTLHVLEKNTAAIRFYQRHGFALTGERHLEPGTTEYYLIMRIKN